jgi:hypothetical protein
MKLHTKRARQKVGKNLRENNHTSPLIALGDVGMFEAIQKARTQAYTMIERHTATQNKRKNLAVLKVFTTFRESLETKNDNLFVVVECDYITQPLRVPDNARLVAS